MNSQDVTWKHTIVVEEGERWCDLTGTPIPAGSRSIQINRPTMPGNPLDILPEHSSVLAAILKLDAEMNGGSLIAELKRTVLVHGSNQAIFAECLQPVALYLGAGGDVMYQQAIADWAGVPDEIVLKIKTAALQFVQGVTGGHAFSSNPSTLRGTILRDAFVFYSDQNNSNHIFFPFDMSKCPFAVFGVALAFRRNRNSLPFDLLKQRLSASCDSHQTQNPVSGDIGVSNENPILVDEIQMQPAHTPNVLTVQAQAGDVGGPDVTLSFEIENARAVKLFDPTDNQTRYVINITVSRRYRSSGTQFCFKLDDRSERFYGFKMFNGACASLRTFLNGFISE